MKQKQKIKQRAKVRAKAKQKIKIVVRTRTIYKEKPYQEPAWMKSQQYCKRCKRFLVNHKYKNESILIPIL